MSEKFCEHIEKGLLLGMISREMAVQLQRDGCPACEEELTHQIALFEGEGGPSYDSEASA